jgi:hypothetical protein
MCVRGFLSETTMTLFCIKGAGPMLPDKKAPGEKPYYN